MLRLVVRLLNTPHIAQIRSIVEQSEARVIKRIDALQNDLHDLMGNTAEKTVKLTDDISAVRTDLDTLKQQLRSV